ncbi:MAG: hypothetical protein WBB82_01370 [Limnothrix sp.]
MENQLFRRVETFNTLSSPLEQESLPVLLSSPLANTFVTDSAPVGVIQEINVRVSSSSDDAEERADGDVSLGSSDLEFVFDQGGDQLTGMRFSNLGIPQGATITNAYLQFQTDEVNTGVANLTIRGEDVDDALTFGGNTGNISSRTTTSAFVDWAPAAWDTKGEAGFDQRTPDISTIIQEIVNRPDWSSGGAISTIISGFGERTAESFDGDASAAPLLHVEYAIS